MEDDAARPDPTGLSPEGGPENADAEPEPLPDPPTPAEAEEAENLVRQANLAKIRGDKDGFQRLLEQAASVAPGSSTVQEALGDAYSERRQVRKAKEAYHAAVRLDPSNASAERKYGEAVLAIQIALDPAFALAPDDGSFASGKASAILSFLIPGLGQLASGSTVFGGVLLGIWALALAWAVSVPNGLSKIPFLFRGGTVDFNGAVMVPLFLMAAAWIVGIAEASAKAKRVQPKKFERPVPPVDKKFEL
ncbi:MAG: hypothetical protein JST30_08705 [Armatimonadetes bacterium]|nr:hypothetical protein [Armatimonadota bacterium]